MFRNDITVHIASAPSPLMNVNEQQNETAAAPSGTAHVSRDTEVTNLVALWSRALVDSNNVLNISKVPKAPHLEDCWRCTLEHNTLDSRSSDGSQPPWTLWKGSLGLAFRDRLNGSGVHTLQGPFVPWVQGGDEDNLPLTRTVQLDIWLNQHPKNCSTAKFLLAHWYGEDQSIGSVGVGSELVSAASMLGAAMQQGRVFVTLPYHGARHNGCKGSNHGRWSCYFVPEASPECIARALELAGGRDSQGDTVTRYHGDGWTDVPRQWGEPWKLMQTTVELEGELITNYRSEHLRWWRAQALRYLTRYPSEYLCRLLNKERHEAFGETAARLVVKNARTEASRGSTALERLTWNSYGPWMPRPMVSVHVRQGDKASEMEVHPFEDYMKLAESLRRTFPDTHNIWLSTEMQNVIDETERYSDWKFYYSNVTRQTGVTSMRAYMNSLGKFKTYTTSFVNLIMASECDFFVGPLGSTWSYIIDGLRTTSGKIMAGFLTVNPINRALARLSGAKEIHSRVSVTSQDVFLLNKLVEMYGRCASPESARDVFDSIVTKDRFSYRLMLQAYSKNGRVSEARKMFEEMEQRDLVAWTVMLSAYAHHGYLTEAKNMFDEMPQRDQVSWSTLLFAYTQNGRLEDAKQMFDTMPEPNLVCYNVMVSAYAQCGHINESRLLFESMPEHNLMTMTAMLGGHGQHGDLNAAKKLFNEMPERDSVSWTAMLTAYARNGDLSNAQQAFASMPERDLFSYNALLSACTANLKEAVAVFESMPERSLISWSSMLGAFAMNGHLPNAKKTFDALPQADMVAWNSMLFAYTQNEHLGGAKLFFENMPCRDSISWSTMLSSYARNGHCDEAKLVFDKMPQRDLTAWTAMLCAYASKGWIDKARDTFNKVPRHDLILTNAMLAAYARSSYLEDAKKMFDSMPERDVVSWNTILVAFCESDQLEILCPLFQMMPEYDIISWNTMLAGYAQAGYMEKTKELFDQMPEKDSVSTNSIVCGYARNGDLEHARYIFDANPSSDLVATHVLIIAYASQGHMLEARRMFDGVLLKGVITWTAMLAAYASNGFVDSASKLFSTMPEWDTISWSAMLAAYAQNGYPREALETFDDMKLVETPNASCFVSALMAASNGSKASAFALFVGMMMDFGVQPCKQHYCCLLDMLGRAGYLELAYDLISSMPFQPDSLDWTCLLGSSINHKNVNHGDVAARKVLGLNPKNGGAHVLVASVYSAL